MIINFVNAWWNTICSSYSKIDAKERQAKMEDDGPIIKNLLSASKDFAPEPIGGNNFTGHPLKFVPTWFHYRMAPFLNMVIQICWEKTKMYISYYICNKRIKNCITNRCGYSKRAKVGSLYLVMFRQHCIHTSYLYIQKY